MPRAEIIAIGTELLLGEIQDTNTAYLARHLRDVGVDVFRATLIGDNPERIAGAIQEALQRAEIVITTGGLGPTVDDPTRQAVADAVGAALEFHPELWQQIQDRFQRYGRLATENNRKQAFIPAGSIPLENPVGTAPAFIARRGDSAVISLPGVPREMMYLYHNAVIPYLRQNFELREIIRAYVLHAAGVGESQIDEWIGDLELLKNPTVGLAAHSGQIDIRITAKGTDSEAIEEMIHAVARQVIDRVGDAIFGAEQDTLHGVLQEYLKETGERMVIAECGLEGQLVRQLPPAESSVVLAAAQLTECSQDELLQNLNRMKAQQSTRYGLGASLIHASQRIELHILWLDGDSVHQIARYYGGPPENAAQWAAKTAMDFSRRCIPIPNLLRNQKKVTDGNR